MRLLMGVHSRSHFLQMKKPGKTNDSSLAEWEWADVNTPRGAPKLITVNSWNEWTEGSYLEPDTYWRFGYLEAVRRVFGNN